MPDTPISPPPSKFWQQIRVAIGVIIALAILNVVVVNNELIALRFWPFGEVFSVPIFAIILIPPIGVLAVARITWGAYRIFKRS